MNLCMDQLKIAAGEFCLFEDPLTQVTLLTVNANVEVYSLKSTLALNCG